MLDPLALNQIDIRRSRGSPEGSRVKVVFITLYNESARGTRFVASAVRSAGHDVAFIHFKRFQMRTVARDDKQTLQWAIAQRPYQVREVTAEGERFHPFPSPATEQERHLLAELIDRLKPDVIGMSFATHAFPLAVELTGLLRETNPSARIVWGGTHAIADPDSCIEHADVVCTGEGEEAFVEYLADPGRTDIAGLWFRTPSGVVRNPHRPLIQDLDSLPWPLYGGDEYEIDDDRVERRMAENPGYICCNFYTETTRGCPFACSYCIHSICRERYVGQRYVRNRSVENIIAEIQSFRRRYGLQAVLPFFDEILLMNKRRFARFAEHYRREIGHPFCGFAHHQTTDREMLEIARDAGIVETSIGLQTGSERIARDIYKRPIERQAIVRLARDIRETGAGRLVVNVLCDCPFEREEDLRQTFELLLEMPRPFLIQLSRIVPFPNTRLARMRCDVPPLERNVREFWNYMYLLTQSERMDSTTLRGLAEDPYLREKPEILDRIAYAVLVGDNGRKEAESAGAAGRVMAAKSRRDSRLRQALEKLRRRMAALSG